MVRYLIGLSFLIVLSATSILRGFIYSDELTLWADTQKKSPNKARPNAEMGRIQMDNRNFLDASIYLERAMALKPDDPGNVEVITNLSNVYYKLGRKNEALSLAYRALEVNPNSLQVRFNLARRYYEEQRYSESASEMDWIIKEFPLSNEAVFARQMKSLMEQPLK